MHTKLTIIPQQDHGLIVEIVDNTVKILHKFDIPYNSISKIIDNKIIVTLDKSNKQLLLHTIDGVFIKSIKVPFGLAMNVKESVVFIGGNANGGEVCYMVDSDSEDQVLQNINLPVPMAYGKAVDDILILGDKMLLIDNIVFPKYTFEYDISDPNKPVWVETVKLPHNRTYENIIKGDMNKDWIIYLSSASCEEGGYVRYITCHKKRNLTFTFANIECPYDSKPVPFFKDIALINDRLYVLTNWGLAYYDLMTPNVKSSDLKFIKQKIFANKILKVNDNMLIVVSEKTYKKIDLKHIDLQSTKSISEQYNKMKIRLYIQKTIRDFKHWLSYLF